MRGRVVVGGGKDEEKWEEGSPAVVCLCWETEGESSAAAAAHRRRTARAAPTPRATVRESPPEMQCGGPQRLLRGFAPRQKCKTVPLASRNDGPLTEKCGQWRRRPSSTWVSPDRWEKTPHTSQLAREKWHTEQQQVSLPLFGDRKRNFIIKV